MINDPGSEIKRSYYASNSWVVRVQTALVIKFLVSCFMFRSCCSHTTSMYLVNTKTYKLGLMQLEFVGLAYRFCTHCISSKCSIRKLMRAIYRFTASISLSIKASMLFDWFLIILENK